ncbi:MAG: hypothetical protein HUU15_15720, partial [Candidatus Brocadiae bacterium]|nr:hypothetical protein [Candidatus Brocadiia bacterium]
TAERPGTVALPAGGLLRPGTRATDAPGTTPYFFKPPWQRREEERLEPVEDPRKDCPPELKKVIEVGLFFEGAGFGNMTERTIHHLSQQYAGRSKYFMTDGSFINAHRNLAEAKEYLSELLCETAILSADGSRLILCGELKIDLFGYSHGAIAALSLADDLRDDGIECERTNANGESVTLRRLPMPVRFLGVIDPVDTAIHHINPGEVTENVENFFGAYASDSVAEKPWFIENTHKTVDLSPKAVDANGDVYPGLDHQGIGKPSKSGLRVLQDMSTAFREVAGATPFRS